MQEEKKKNLHPLSILTEDDKNEEILGIKFKLDDLNSKVKKLTNKVKFLSRNSMAEDEKNLLESFQKIKDKGLRKSIVEMVESHVD